MGTTTTDAGRKELTVDGNGDSLAESEAILANEGRDLAEGVGLEVLNGSGLGKVDFGDVEVEAVCLSDGLDGDAAGVVLDTQAVSNSVLLCIN
jgi:hypothetical protein